MGELYHVSETAVSLRRQVACLWGCGPTNLLIHALNTGHALDPGESALPAEGRLSCLSAEVLPCQHKEKVVLAPGLWFFFFPTELFGTLEMVPVNVFWNISAHLGSFYCFSKDNPLLFLACSACDSSPVNSFIKHLLPPDSVHCSWLCTCSRE